VVTRVRARFVLAAACLVSGAAAANACFPDYQVGPGDGGGGTDGTTADAAGDGTSADGATGPDGTTPADGTGGDTGGSDGGGGGDVQGDTQTPPADVNIPDGLVNVVTIPSGTYQFQVHALDGGLVDATASINYNLAIDVDEVTVVRFKAWIAAGMPLPEAGAPLDPQYPTMTWKTSWNGYAHDSFYADAAACNTPLTSGYHVTFDDPLQTEPLNCVVWEQALAFCAWDQQKRLPTDTEWRIVATSEGHRSPYPWGDAGVTCSYATYDDQVNYCGFPRLGGTANLGNTEQNVHDIIGSLSEWLWDEMDNAGYSYPANPAQNYPGPSSGTGQRIWIGGDYTSRPDAAELRVDQSGPFSSSPEENYNNMGWRCAKSL
jgi:formylglycine-generating enzyme required for sulfatase activity